MGSRSSVASYLIEKAAGIQLNYVVFNSGGEVNAALLGGHIDMAVSNPGESIELYQRLFADSCNSFFRLRRQ